MSEPAKVQVKIHDIVMLKVEDCVPNAWNPNAQDEKTFNALVDEIKTNGFAESIEVVPFEDDSGRKKYKIIGGEHRWRAMKVLEQELIPATLHAEWDDDRQKFQTMRMNMLRGKLDPTRFTKLFNEMASKYGDDVVKAEMAFLDEKAFKSVYQQARSALPKEMQKQLDKSKDEIRNVDDLSKILNSLFSEYSDTLAYDFMVFDYGGKNHIWVKMTPGMKSRILELKANLIAQRSSMAAFFEQLLARDMEDILSTLPAVDDPDTGALPGLDAIFQDDTPLPEDEEFGEA